MAALYTDLHECGSPCLPPGAQGMHGSRLAGPLLLQINELVNVGAGAAENGGGGEGGIPSARDARRMLKLALTDGASLLPALELAPLPELGAATVAGAKIVVRNVLMRRGLALLRPENVSVLGGGVAELAALQQFVLEQARAKHKLVAAAMAPPADRSAASAAAAAAVGPASAAAVGPASAAAVGPASASSAKVPSAAAAAAAASAALDGLEASDIFSQQAPAPEPPVLAGISPSRDRYHRERAIPSAAASSAATDDGGLAEDVVDGRDNDDDDGIAPLDFGIDSPLLGGDEAYFSLDSEVDGAAATAAAAAMDAEADVLIVDGDLPAVLSPKVTIRPHRQPASQTQLHSALGDSSGRGGGSGGASPDSLSAAAAAAAASVGSSPVLFLSALHALLFRDASVAGASAHFLLRARLCGVKLSAAVEAAAPSVAAAPRKEVRGSKLRVTLTEPASASAPASSASPSHASIDDATVVALVDDACVLQLSAGKSLDEIMRLARDSPQSAAAVEARTCALKVMASLTRADGVYRCRFALGDEAAHGRVVLLGILSDEDAAKLVQPAVEAQLGHRV